MASFLIDVGVSFDIFKFVMNVEKYGFDPTETPRTDKLVNQSILCGF